MPIDQFPMNRIQADCRVKMSAEDLSVLLPDQAAAVIEGIGNVLAAKSAPHEPEVTGQPRA